MLPEDKFKDVKIPEQTFKRVAGKHHKEWVDACKGGPRPFCNFSDYGAKLTEVMLVGAIGQRLGKNFEWDSKNMVAKGLPEAERFIRRDYRKGWGI